MSRYLIFLLKVRKVVFNISITYFFNQAKIKINELPSAILSDVNIVENRFFKNACFKPLDFRKVQFRQNSQIISGSHPIDFLILGLLFLLYLMMILDRHSCLIMRKIIEATASLKVKK